MNGARERERKRERERARKSESESFSSVQNIYPDHKVIKYECRSRAIAYGKQVTKQRKKTKGLGRPGRVNDNMIGKLQSYYGIAIRKNSGKTVEVMKKAIWGGIFHVCSSKGKPYHDHCDESWCKYLQDDKNKTNTYVPGPGLPKECVKEVYLVLGYQKSVLRRCTWSWVTKRVG